MKKMATIMTDAITIMIHVVQKHAEDRSEANFYDLFQALTLDVIGNFVRILCIIAYPSMCIFMDLYFRTCVKLIDRLIFDMGFYWIPNSKLSILTLRQKPSVNPSCIFSDTPKHRVEYIYIFQL